MGHAFAPTRSKVVLKSSGTREFANEKNCSKLNLQIELVVVLLLLVFVRGGFYGGFETSKMATA